MKNRFEGKVAIVTGGASGIGLATVDLLVREGAKVVAADMNQESLDKVAQKYGENVLALKIDVSKPEQVEKMVKTTVTHFGKLDILHNNAGIGGFGLIPHMDFEEWKKVFSIDVDGVFLGCKYAIPEMKKNGGGVIVNTASISGLRADYAMAYIDDDLTIYLRDGDPLAYLSNSNDGWHVYGFNGKHLGWYVKGIIYDQDGDAVAAQKDATNMITSIEGIKGIKTIKPIKSIKEIAPIQPIFSKSWSKTPLVLFLRAGED